MHNPYLKNFCVIHDRHVCYTTKKMYVENDFKLSSKTYILILLFPIIYMLLSFTVFYLLNMSHAAFIGMFIGGIIASTLLGMLMASWDYQKKIHVHLFRDPEKIAFNIGHWERVIHHPKKINIAIHEYPIYGRAGRYIPIIMIAFDIIAETQLSGVKPVETLRLVSIQCKSVAEAKKIYQQIVDAYEPLTQYLNLPLIHELAVVKHQRFFYLK